MKTIHKFELRRDFPNTQMPVGAKILSCQMQGSSMCIWAEVETDAQLEHRRFTVLGTGQRFPTEQKLSYLATVQEIYFDGTFVWHLYEVLS